VIAGLDDLAYDLQADGGSQTTTSGAGGDGGAATTTSSSASATSTSSSSSSASGTGGQGGTGGGASSSGTGGTGGTGGDGGGPTCGDGIISAGEECDDQNVSDGDGCVACLVECSGPGELVDPTTHHCYRLHADTKSWSVAGATCMTEGFTLAAISSAPEQTLIEGYLVVNTNTWVGGNDLAAEGAFVWSNGEIFGFTNWDAGEPNDNNGEDCMKLDGNSVPIGKWDDNDCGISHRYLCERAPPGIPE
jgi:cysteine-rich repeat protein